MRASTASGSDSDKLSFHQHKRGTHKWNCKAMKTFQFFDVVELKTPLTTSVFLFQ